MFEYDDVTATLGKQSQTGLLKRIWRRVGQFLRGVTAAVSAEALTRAREHLPPAAFARFCQMPVDAQRHSLNVLADLQAAGWTDADLAGAALLHDVGKVAVQKAGLWFNPWVRTALVLLDALAPALPARLAVDDPTRSWRYLLHVHLAHPEIGAVWAAAGGCSQLTCWLIANHQRPVPPNPVLPNPVLPNEDRQRRDLLAALQWADNRN